MSKFDNEIINTINRLASLMEKEASGKHYDPYKDASLTFYSLFLNHLIYNPDNLDYYNKDRLIINNKYIRELYSTISLLDLDISIDDLKEFKKFNTKTSEVLKGKHFLGSVFSSDSIGLGVGVSLGERYLGNLYPKKVDFKTYVVCDTSDLMGSNILELFTMVKDEKLSKLTIIVLNDTLLDVYKMVNNYNFNIVEVNGNKLSNIDEAIDDAKESNKPSLVIINKVKDKVSEQEVKDSFAVDPEIYKYIKKTVKKRLSKFHEEDAYESLNKLDYNINFNIDNIKLNDNYEEELNVGNAKIFNIFANKSPLILNIGKDKAINSSGIMSKDDPLGKNIIVSNYNSMGIIANGLAYLGLKVFVNLPLIYMDVIKQSINYSTRLSLDVNYIFLNDSFINTYEDMGVSPTSEIDDLRNTINMTTFRPCDINEILGIYNILKNYKKPCSIIINSVKSKKLVGTNPNYVVAGLYRIKREKGELNGILISSGHEVYNAIRIANDLLEYGIDLRVISAPSIELFKMQSDRYKNMLLPKDIKIFTLEYSSSNTIGKFATDVSHVIGINKYSYSGTNVELLKYNELDLDSIKRKIVEKYK